MFESFGVGLCCGHVSKTSFQKLHVLCISECGTYESAHFEELRDLLSRAAIPYVVVCQFNSDGSGIGNRALAKEFLACAFRVAFVSRGNLKSVERQIAHALTNAIVLQNPVNLSDLSAVSYPSSSQVNIASVARLSARHKGQDILFEILGS